MQSKQFQILLLLLIIVFVGYLFSSSGGKIGRTEVGCTCHGNLPEGNSAISLSASPNIFSNGYSPGETYALSIAVTGGPTGGGGGFNLKASAGSFSNPGSNAQIISGEVTHSSPNARSWTVDWTAPDASVDSVVFNFAGNSVNLNGSSSGDDPTPLGRLVAQKSASSVSDNHQGHIESFELFQNYPNPFNSWTKIPYQINAPGTVQLGIFSLNGEKVFSETYHHQQAGNYQFIWNGRDGRGKLVTSGIYIYKITFNNQYKIKQLLFLK